MQRSEIGRSGAAILAALFLLAAAPTLTWGVAMDGACCLESGNCRETTDFDCESAGGSFIGFGTTCAEVDCGISVAAPALSLFGILGAAGAVLAAAIWRLLPVGRRR